MVFILRRGPGLQVDPTTTAVHHEYITQHPLQEIKQMMLEGGRTVGNLLISS